MTPDTCGDGGTNHVSAFWLTPRGVLDIPFFNLTSILSKTLQLVGQKLLFHATQQLPVLASLPDTVPVEIIRSLYTRPFVQALQMVSGPLCRRCKW